MYKVGDKIEFSWCKLDKTIESEVKIGTITKIYGLLFKKYIVVYKDFWGRSQAIIMPQKQIIKKLGD